MNAIIFKSAIFIHVLCGIASLVSGLVAMLVRKKGGKVHNAAGSVFYYSMLVILVTTTIFFVLDPTNLKYQFFLGIGIVSFYPAFSGKRILKMKKIIAPTQLDIVAVWLVGVCGLVMLGYAIMVQDFSYRILFGVFGSICLGNFYGDWTLYTGRRQPEKMHWFLGHAGKMIGSYSAATTAFCVNIVPRFFPKNTPDFVFLLVWTLPATIFAIVTVVLLKKYRKKFASA